MDPDQLSKMLLWGVAFIYSTTIHEAAHAWAALKGGDPTAYHGGQVTLNPLPHIKRSPFGMVLVPLVCFALSNFMIGWASTPYDPNWAQRHPRRSALMSLAGPAANGLIVIVCFIALKLGLSSGVFVYESGLTLSAAAQGSFWEPVVSLISITFSLNIILMVFNLIPLPPLDGAEGILLFFPEDRANEIREKMQMLGIFGLFIAWAIFNRIVDPILIFGWRTLLF